MTVYERLFGTPERAARTLDDSNLDCYDYCDMLDAISHDRGVKCQNCIFICDRYWAKRKDVTLLEWLKQEVVE